MGKAFDPETASRSIQEGAKSFFAGSGCKKIVLGLSGGIDSALCARLLVDAVGNENIIAVLMPHSGITDENNTADAKGYAEKLGISAHLAPIDRISAGMELPWNSSRLAEMNTHARFRAVILYNLANSEDALVCGTSNRTEMLLGYFTKYGDGASDFKLIGELYKTEVYELAKHLGLPSCFLDKRPTAELARGQTDEKELGASYTDIDTVLKQRFDEGIAWEKITGADKAVIQKLMTLVNKNAHKREMPTLINAGISRK